MYSGNRTMITRLFLFMLAIVSGVSAAQASSPVRAGEPAVGVASTLVSDNVDAASVLFKVPLIWHYPLQDTTNITCSIKIRLTWQSPQSLPMMNTFKSDRLRQ
jgi:hypothetical protein